MNARLPTGQEPLRVLLVEDSDDDGVLVIRELRRHGFALEHLRVETREALSSALDGGPWDVILAESQHFLRCVRFSKQCPGRLVNACVRCLRRQYDLV